MEEKKVTKEELQKQYDALKTAANELEYQNQKLQEYVKQCQATIQDMNLTNAFKRLDYLFKVVEFAHMFSDDFVTECVNELEESITRPAQPEQVDSED